MEEIIFTTDTVNSLGKYSQKPAKMKTSTAEKTHGNTRSVDKYGPLTTKNAVKFLLEGKLNTVVCRYCLNVAPSLSELDQILHVAGPRTMYKVTIKDMVASFYPVKVIDDPNLPDKICNKCINLTLSAYLFTQQCERSERALRNCFIDMYEKVEKLDPLERPRKRGRQKLNVNYNVLHTEHEKVIDYAEPIINIVNLGTETVPGEPEMTELECKRCWQVLPNIDSLLNHEKTHPSTMWFHCRLCGKSFPKRNLFKRHYDRVHVLGKGPRGSVPDDFVCNECGHATDSYKLHLQHMEKHKFTVIMKHLVEKKMDNLCVVCLDKSTRMVDLDTIVCIHGGYPELMGDKILQRVLASTLPNLDSLDDYLGKKICDKCLNNAITSYVFINQFTFARERLDICVSHTLKNIANINPGHNIFVHIPDSTILPLQDFDETLLLGETDYVDESKLKVDVLEDEFRLKSDSESDNEVETEKKSTIINTERKSSPETDDDLENPAKNATKTYMKKKWVNGLQNNKYTDICSEFLTFKKKPKRRCRYTCPLCSKHFISDYFLKRHILKHVNKKVQCNTCKSTFKSKFYLYEHTKMMHLLKTTKFASCKVCGRAFLKREKLKSHEKRHKTVACQLCGKIYFNQKHFNSHMQRHETKLMLLSRSKLQTCSFCEKECSNDNQLSLHVNKVHFAIKPYSCDMCDRQFYTQNNLKCHKRIHSMPSKEVCVFCNKCSKTRKHLLTHIRKHIGAKPFVCQICGQSFYSQAKARKHMRESHGGWYCCGICKITFKTKFGLKDHINKEHGFI